MVGHSSVTPRLVSTSASIPVSVDTLHDAALAGFVDSTNFPSVAVAAQNEAVAHAAPVTESSTARLLSGTSVHPLAPAVGAVET
jgi:hypothetical protein